MRKSFLFILSASLFMASCGNNGDSKSGGSKDTPAATATVAAPSPSEKGLELIGSNDCTACHSVRKGQGSNTGPAYEDVAAKYNPAADTTVTRLMQKIKTGGNGVWGSNMMTPHPALSDSDTRTMVTYILAIKKS